MKKNSDHIVVCFKDTSIRCLNCSVRQEIKLPISIDELAKKAKAFMKLHIDCEKRG